MTRRKSSWLGLGCALWLASACGPEKDESTLSWRMAREGFTTEIFLEHANSTPPTIPPSGVFDLVRYPAPLGANAAYVSPAQEGKRRPAMVWIAGGFDWRIGSDSWEPAGRDNDQSAAAFRQAGIVLMRPSLRGSNGSPGRNECFFGEVEDVIAAAEYLAARPDVDPERIYLAGHSTGGTLALLVAATNDRFRAVFAFGPVEDTRSYGDTGCLPSDASDLEAAMRAPRKAIPHIMTPTFLIEGAVDGNGPAAEALYAARASAPVELVLVPGKDHFSVLAPGTEVVASAIQADTAAYPDLSLDAALISRR